jgi:transposase
MMELPSNHRAGENRMQLKTILNRIHRFPSFVFDLVRWEEERGQGALHIRLLPRANSRPRCSHCLHRGGIYDTQPLRNWEFVPLWGLRVFFEYAPRRVNCPRCGVKVEHLPWATGKHRLTEAYVWFLSRWAKRLAWKQVAEIFHSSWDTVFRAVEQAVDWGRAHQSLAGLTAIGIDEVCWKKPYQFLTVVYQIDAGARRLLWIGQHRTAKTLLRFFRWLGPEATTRLRFICSDMWQAYLKVVARKASHALHVLDRFHVVARMNEAIDEIRAGEARRLKQAGYEPVLKHSRWCLLKRPENLTDRQEIKLAELLRYNLKTVRAYLLKEEFQFFWGYASAFWAGWFLDGWCSRVMRSRLEPLKKVARSLRGHRELLLNWFRAKGQISAGAVEGLNNKLKVTARNAYGFRSYRVAQVALYHALGNLPEPETIHRFC